MEIFSIKDSSLEFTIFPSSRLYPRITNREQILKIVEHITVFQRGATDGEVAILGGDFRKCRSTGMDRLASCANTPTFKSPVSSLQSPLTYQDTRCTSLVAIGCPIRESVPSVRDVGMINLVRSLNS